MYLAPTDLLICSIETIGWFAQGKRLALDNSRLHFAADTDKI